MIQIRAGDLLAIEQDSQYVYAMVLTRQVLFGGHWSFLWHGATERLLSSEEAIARNAVGFNAVVDYIVANREDRLTRLSRKNDVSPLPDPPLLKQYLPPPVSRAGTYRIWKWSNKEGERADVIKTAATLSNQEQQLPDYSCLPIDLAWTLAARGWMYDQDMWKIARDA